MLWKNPDSFFVNGNPHQALSDFLEGLSSHKNEDGLVGKCIRVSRKLSTMFLNKAFKETKQPWLKRGDPSRGK